ncbi:MAG: type I-B CRISPR-associated protein Cas7/Csh2 [Deltaproteobacteria bacterium]|nr:type I-B CRISPR-associated protein Cas7/Csh2 [Deltaproteobacteria bacterium]
MPKIKNRSEILFLYDATDMNPNGDPVDENKPRIDEETGINIVTDVRIKRSIRDYLYEYKKQEIFVRGDKDTDGIIKAREDRLKEFHNNSKELIDKCIDIRLFGATIAVPKDKNKKKEQKNKSEDSLNNDEEENTKNGEETKNITLTGPIQFKYGRSMHKIDITYIKGTTVFPSKQNKSQGTFTEKYILPYSLIAVYGIVNENAARNQNINLTEEDIYLLLEGLWNGTKNLITTSKFGQIPRFLIQIKYKENSNFYLGELDRRIKLNTDIEDKQIRKISDVKIDVTDLIDSINKYKDKIDNISIKTDDWVNFVYKQNSVQIAEILKDFNFGYLNF